MIYPSDLLQGADAAYDALGREGLLLLAAIPSFCDDAGDFPASSRWIGRMVDPYDPLPAERVERYVEALIGAGLLLRYEAEGAEYLHCPQVWRAQARKTHYLLQHPLPPHLEQRVVGRQVLVVESSRTRRAGVAQPSRTVRAAVAPPGIRDRDTEIESSSIGTARGDTRGREAPPVEHPVDDDDACGSADADPDVEEALRAVRPVLRSAHDPPREELAELLSAAGGDLARIRAAVARARERAVGGAIGTVRYLVPILREIGPPPRAAPSVRMVCPSCGGSGRWGPGDEFRCGVCEGRGSV